MGKKPQQVPVTPRALTQRLNRVLAKEGKVLRGARGKQKTQLGDYYILKGDGVIETRVDLAALGRKLKVLAAWEELTE